jgi:hypothetical protein
MHELQLSYLEIFKFGSKFLSLVWSNSCTLKWKQGLAPWARTRADHASRPPPRRPCPQGPAQRHLFATCAWQNTTAAPGFPLLSPLSSAIGVDTHRPSLPQAPRAMHVGRVGKQRHRPSCIATVVDSPRTTSRARHSSSLPLLCLIAMRHAATCHGRRASDRCWPTAALAVLSASTHVLAPPPSRGYLQKGHWSSRARFRLLRHLLVAPPPWSSLSRSMPPSTNHPSFSPGPCGSSPSRALLRNTATLTGIRSGAGALPRPRQRRSLEPFPPWPTPPIRREWARTPP